jgi:hypothetical protein
VFLEFCGSGCCEGHACSDEHVVGEDGDPFHFCVEGLDAIVSTAHVRNDLVFEGGVLTPRVECRLLRGGEGKDRRWR